MKKGQAAMEFLMTYGWAILVVLAAIGALAYFGVLSPNKLLPERTQFQAPLANADIAEISINTVTDVITVEIAFRNNVGYGINVTNGTGSITDLCGNALVSSTHAGSIVPNGDPFIFIWTCNAAAGEQANERADFDLSFEYENVETGQTRRHGGSVQGKIVAE